MTTEIERAEGLAGPSIHLFFSPHYDDIALSAGATVALLADLGRSPETVIVFGSEPDSAQPLSPFAEGLHRAWGLSADQVIARRHAEEDAAAAILGARTRVLPFRDAIYRGHVYLSDDDLFGAPAAAEEALPEAIVAASGFTQAPTNDVRLYAPLAVGRHVDHQLVFRAARELAARGWDVWFYEDTPYVLKPGALQARLAEIGASSLEPAALGPAEPGWERKLDAILSYPSQLETVFRQYVGVGTSRDEIAAALATHARQSGDGQLVERFWRLREAPHHRGS
jgi:LmbE family N-acetylglucosaminyl deacetylase